MKDKIRELASKYHSEIVGIRRHLHAHPELSYQEIETAKYVCSILDKYKINYQKGVGGHGIVAHIGNGEDTIALRADMDALPILEKNEVDYKSQNEGVMHACGHDVHTSSLLGAAIILKSIEDSLKVKVRMLFQPAEEKLPGGASLMIKDGVLENPKPKHIIGQHVHPPLEVRKVGLKAGINMASAERWPWSIASRLQ